MESMDWYYYYFIEIVKDYFYQHEADNRFGKTWPIVK